MKQLIRILLAACFTVSLLGCEGYRGVAGIIVDKKTKLPLEGVVCEAVDSNPFILHKKALATVEPYYTDTTGSFQLNGEFGGCMPECPDIIVRFSKKGYDTLQVRNPTDSVFHLVQHSY